MGYQTLNFILFSVAALVVYYAAGLLGGKAQRLCLLAANICFYLIAGAKYAPFLAVTLLTSYLAARFIGGQYKKRDAALSEPTLSAPQKKELSARTKTKTKAVLLVGLLVCLGLLIFCKYTPFLLQNANTVLRLFGIRELPLFKTVLPLGISFYTFMAVGYVLDIYWERYEAEKSFLNYALFLTYFPHIVQGPIDRYKDFRSQLSEKAVKPEGSVLVKGFELALWGFFKKLVIADRLALFVEPIYDQPGKYTGLIVVLATVLYSIQIYADFSGCIDIVSGVSEMFGIRLKKNFNHPYFSRDIPEFWRRWHISLGEWFKDYVYFPVSASRPVKGLKKKLRKKGKRKAADILTACIPTAVVWAITGFWHGASWNFAAWGLYYAFIMVLGIVLKEPLGKLNTALNLDTESFSFRLWQMLRTFVLCTVGRVFFRAQGLRNALLIFKGIFSGFAIAGLTDGNLFTYGLDRSKLEVAILAIIVLTVVDILQEKTKLRESLEKQNIVFRWTALLIGIFSVIIFGIYGPGFDAGAFIYEQF